MEDCSHIGCCGTLNDNTEVKCVETDKGFRVEYEGKDAKTAAALKKLIKAKKELCGCD